MTSHTRKPLLLDRRQRKALASPIRLEILGQFTTPGGMSIADVARRMGRTAGSLYYHFRMLERVGILRQVGTRPGVKRDEALYEPVADRFAIPAPRSTAEAREAVTTMRNAFRMAQRDLEEALGDENSRPRGKYRNTIAYRFHCRATRDELAEINRHLDAIEKTVYRIGRRKKLPPDADEYFSLTLALLPLRGRGKS